MGYKVLGFAVWQGGKWYVRRRYGGAARKLAIGALAAVVIAGLLAAQRRSAES
jgi:uncharacterized membrane protein YhfC